MFADLWSLSAWTVTYTYSYDYKSKNKGAVNDLNEVMVGAISASWGKLFHIDTVLGTKDDLKALVRACGI